MRIELEHAGVARSRILQVAAGLAHVAWSDYIRMQCMQRGIMRTPEVRPDGSATIASGAAGANGLVVQSHLVKGYLNRMGIKV